MENNSLSKILVLIILGYIIYILSTDNYQSSIESCRIKNEHFENTQSLSTIPEVPTTEVPTTGVPTTGVPTNGVPIKSSTFQTNSELLNAFSNIPNVSPTISDDKSNLLSLQSNNSALVEDPIHNFVPDESSGYMNADFDTAFENSNIPIVSPNTVNLNKNNPKKYDAKDYLPKEINDTWFDTDFSQAKFNIENNNLINTERYVIGINTVGQSLKNASYDIRGTIANPKYSISPWNNSTYEADYNIKPLC